MKEIEKKYEIIKTLGEGGFGTVYLVQHRELKTLYALKILREEISGDEQMIARFKREAQILSQFSHKNSVSLRDFGRTEEGHLYMAMDYCDGKNLSHILQEKGHFSSSEALEIFIQILEVLGEAHKMGIIHRDMKPENIMILPGKISQQVKVLDFGIAKLKENLKISSTTITQNGLVIGTPIYMSPEQAGGEMEVDIRSDIYSLGLLLYEVTTGEKPFSVESVDRLLRIQMTQYPPKFKDLGLSFSIPQEMEDLIWKAIQKEKEERYQSVEEFLQACRKVQEKLESTRLAIPGFTRMETKRAVASPQNPFSSWIFSGLFFLVGLLFSGLFFVYYYQPLSPPVLSSKDTVDPEVQYEYRKSKAIQALEKKNYKEAKENFALARKWKKDINLEEMSLRCQIVELMEESGKAIQEKNQEKARELLSRLPPLLSRLSDKNRIPLEGYFFALRGGYSLSAKAHQRNAFGSTNLLSNGKILISGGASGSDLNRTGELFDFGSSAFFKTGNLNMPRMFHTSTLLSSGKVLLAGGARVQVKNGFQSQVACEKTELYDPEKGIFSLQGNLNHPRHNHTSTLLASGKVLITGGRGVVSMNNQDIYNVLSSAEIYDPATQTFALTGFMNLSRYEHTATLLPGGQVVIAGGAFSAQMSNRQWYPNISLNQIETYHPDQEKFFIQALMNQARHGHTATLLPNGKILLVGGCTGGDGYLNLYLNSAEIYDPEKHLCTYTGSLSIGRTYHTAILLPEGKVLITGGYNNTGILSNGEIYDPATERFYPCGNLYVPRSGKATLLPNGKVLISGGLQKEGCTGQGEIYDPYLYLPPSEIPEIEKINGANQFPLSVKFGQILHLSGIRFPYNPEEKGSLCLMGFGSSGLNYQNNSLPSYFQLFAKRKNSTEMEVRMPETNGVPGFYILFLVTEKGVSSGKILKLE